MHAHSTALGRRLSPVYITWPSYGTVVSCTVQLPAYRDALWPWRLTGTWAIFGGALPYVDGTEQRSVRVHANRA